MKKWRCTVCGYIHTGPEPPEKCPVCGSDKSLFEEIIEQEPAVAPAEAAKAPEGFFDYLFQQMLKHHLHPIAVHIPNGVLPVAVIFIILSLFTGSKALETAAFYNLVFVLLTLPFVLFSGLVEWRRRYKGAWTSQFRAKIMAASVVTACAVVVVAWWAVVPELLQSASPLKWIFLAINAVMLAAAATAGFLGGKFVFRD